MNINELDSDAAIWIAVQFEVDRGQEDLASWLVVEAGANGSEVITSDSGAVRLHASFQITDSEQAVAHLKQLLEKYGLAASISSLTVARIAEEDWLAKWKEGYEPFDVGEKFLICPPWLEDTLSPDMLANRYLIVIEPGMAFGTGLHETTQYCLAALESQLPSEDVIDVGTGSGILAIAAAKIFPGAHVVGLDIDPLALRVAQDNLNLNGLEDWIELIEGSTEVLDDQSADCILSNLTCEDIIALLIDYLRVLRPNGIIICAGILTDRLPLLEKALESYPLKIVDQQIGETWAGVTLMRIPVTVGSP